MIVPATSGTSRTSETTHRCHCPPPTAPENACPRPHRSYSNNRRPSASDDRQNLRVAVPIAPTANPSDSTMSASRRVPISLPNNLQNATATVRERQQHQPRERVRSSDLCRKQSRRVNAFNSIRVHRATPNVSCLDDRQQPDFLEPPLRFLAPRSNRAIQPDHAR